MTPIKTTKAAPKAEAPDVPMVRDFKAARRTSVPLLGIATPDQAATMLLLDRSVAPENPIVAWDTVRGLHPRNEVAAAMLEALKNDPLETANPVAALLLAERFEAGSVLYMINAAMFLDADKVFRQAVWNLRDPFKLNRRTLLLMGPALNLPAEIEKDVIVLDEPLPVGEALEAIILRQFENADIAKPTAEDLSRAVDAVAGLHAFAVEQVVAMSLRRSGLDFDALWNFKIEIIEQTKGLSVWKDTQSFDDIGGNDQAKLFLRRFAKMGNFRLVWWIDEIEKSLAAMHTDSSGVSQDQHQVLLTVLQDEKIPAILLIGQPGSGKSAVAKALGNECGGITVRSDIGETKGGLVGESEQNIRGMIKMLLAMGQGRILLVATCNDVGALEKSPELMRRFKLPKFYFDLPSAEERDVIWQIKGREYGIDVTQRPKDEGWTGAEIESCVETASRLKVSIREAAIWIVPMVESSPEIIEARRKAAHGRYLSSSVPGKYTMPDKSSRGPVPSPAGRAISFES